MRLRVVLLSNAHLKQVAAYVRRGERSPLLVHAVQRRRRLQVDKLQNISSFNSFINIKTAQLSRDVIKYVFLSHIFNIDMLLIALLFLYSPQHQE